MSAPQEITISKLGIIAGGGSLPAHLVSVCAEKSIEPYIVGFEGQTDKAIMADNNHLWSHLGSAGKIINYFQTSGVKDLVLIGNIKRPPLTDIKPDLKAVKILSRIGLKALGDNSLLTALKEELQNEGLIVHGIHRFCDDLLIKEGPLGKFSPKPEDKVNIDLGLHVSQKIGALDIGQSVIVQDGVVIGVEAVEGTDELIKRCTPLLKKGGRGMLVKTCKPNQDKDLDLPTIGPETIENAYKAGLKGIIAQVGHVIVIDGKTVAEYADQYKMFVSGVHLTPNNN